MLSEVRQQLQAAFLDPVAFFGDDPERTFREYAVKLHPDATADSDEAQQLFRDLVRLKKLVAEPLPSFRSPERTYHARSVLARGDFCDVYYAVSGLSAYVLKVPYVEHKAANNLLAKEREVLEALHERCDNTTYQHYLPKPVESFVDGKKRVNAFSWKSGLWTLQEIQAKHRELDGRHVAWMCKRLLTVIGYAHRKGWAHCAVLPPHAMYSVADHGCCLMDWTCAVELGKPVRIVPAKYKPWYPAYGKTASPGLDIYLAAKSLLTLLPVEPLIQQFLAGCTLESLRMQPTDAWELLTEFTDLLDTLYGPPQFVELEM